jgi:hypothetical protein
LTPNKANEGDSERRGINLVLKRQVWEAPAFFAGYAGSLEHFTGENVGTKKVLIMGSGHIELPQSLCREDAVFMPSQKNVQNGFDALMAKMPTLADITASKHKKARIQRAQAKRRKHKR